MIPWPPRARTIPAYLLPRCPLPPNVFPTLRVRTVKETYLETLLTKRQGLTQWQRDRVGVGGNISSVWMGCLFGHWKESMYLRCTPGKAQCRGTSTFDTTSCFSVEKPSCQVTTIVLALSSMECLTTFRSVDLMITIVRNKHHYLKQQ